MLQKLPKTCTERDHLKKRRVINADHRDNLSLKLILLNFIEWDLNGHIRKMWTNTEIYFWIFLVRLLLVFQQQADLQLVVLGAWCWAHTRLDGECLFLYLKMERESQVSTPTFRGRIIAVMGSNLLDHKISGLVGGAEYGIVEFGWLLCKISDFYQEYYGTVKGPIKFYALFSESKTCN